MLKLLALFESISRFARPGRAPYHLQDGGLTALGLVQKMIATNSAEMPRPNRKVLTTDTAFVFAFIQKFLKLLEVAAATLARGGAGRLPKGRRPGCPPSCNKPSPDRNDRAYAQHDPQVQWPEPGP